MADTYLETLANDLATGIVVPGKTIVETTDKTVLVEVQLEQGPQGVPGVPLLVLGPTDPVPPGTPAGTVIVRTTT